MADPPCSVAQANPGKPGDAKLKGLKSEKLGSWQPVPTSDNWSVGIPISTKDQKTSGVPKMLKQPLHNLAVKFPLIVFCIFILSFAGGKSCLALPEPDQSNSQNTQTLKNDTALDPGGRVCLFKRSKTAQFIKKAVNIDGFMSVTRVEAQSGVVKILADSK